jgi:hypothetical protein
LHKHQTQIFKTILLIAHIVGFNSIKMVQINHKNNKLNLLTLMELFINLNFYKIIKLILIKTKLKLYCITKKRFNMKIKIKNNHKFQSLLNLNS